MAKNKTDNILEVKKSDQYKTIEELLKKSESNSVYYALLVLSAGIVTIGLMLENAAVVIGGMLVTPLLTPILVIALGISTGQIKAIRYSGLTVAKSLAVVIVISFVLAMIFGFNASGSDIYKLANSSNAGILYFIVAFVSGIAATFAWVRRETDSVLPGIAIAVSLVPPLSLLGIGIGIWSVSLMRDSFLIFISNFVGIILGSMIVFSLLRFYKTEKKIEKEVEQTTQKAK